MPAPIIAIPRRMNFGRPQLTRLGPWASGINQRFNPEGVGAQSLPYASNVDVLPTGELRQRPSFKRIDAYSAFGTNAAVQTAVNPGNSTWHLDETYFIGDSTTGTGITATGSNMSLMGIFRDNFTQTVSFTNLTGRFNGANGANVAEYHITSSNVVVYNGKAYGIVQATSLTGTPGHIWSVDLANPGGGLTFSANAIPTASATGYPANCTIIKDRMYAWNYLVAFNYSTGSDGKTNIGVISYSKTGDPNTFSGDPDAGFFSLSPSNDSTVYAPTAIVGIRNTIYIFTNTGTWTLSLPASGIPTNGVLQNISQHIGSTWYNTVAVYDNKVYVAGISGIYEIINGNFIDVGYALGQRVNKVLSWGNNTGATMVSLSVAEDKLWFGVCPAAGAVNSYDPPLDTFYIFNFKSRAWSSYKMGPAAGAYLGGNSKDFATNKVLPFNSTLYLGGGVKQSHQTGGTQFSTTYSSGVLLTDTSTGFVFLMNDNEPDNLNFSSQAIYVWADQIPHYLDISTTVFANIIVTIWTQDMEGGTVETASMKRYYAVTSNLFTPKFILGGINVSVTMTLTDHNGNTITDTSVTFTTVQGQSYYSIKNYTSLRARHIQYKLVINPGTSGPFSLLNLDVLAKVKSSMPDAAVGG